MDRVRALIDISRPSTALSSVLTSIACSVSEGNPFNEVNSIVLMLLYLGVFLSHLSVNVFNDYFDYKSGLDILTPKTPFSGGSKVLVEGRLSEREALVFGLALLLISASIGLYLAFLRGFLIILFMLAGAAIIILYTRILTRYSLGELSVYLKGVVVGAGSSYVVFNSITPRSIILASFYGLASMIILYMNSIPDRDLDKLFGRRTLSVITPLNRLADLYRILIVASALNIMLISLFYGFGLLLLILSIPSLSLLIYNSVTLERILSRGFARDLSLLSGVLGVNILSYRSLEFMLLLALMLRIALY
ncbi:MAG: prenyltransferase [Sulfolobales archaeon]